MPVPVLTFAAQPGGVPPPVLLHGPGDYALRPVGGEPMLVLRQRSAVLRALLDGHYFAMAGVTPAGDLAGCPLTGAEMQSPDGGLLNMDGAPLRAYRRRIGHLFTPAAAEVTRPGTRALVRYLTASLAGGGTVDVLAGYAEPFTAEVVSWAMGTPAADWGLILGWSQSAFAVVRDRAAAGDVAGAWGDLYAYYTELITTRPGDTTLTGLIATALDGFTTEQVTHTVATVSNGFGAVLPVLAVALAELAQRPGVVNACLRGHQTWEAATDRLLATRVMFPVALPRVVLADTRLDGVPVTAGTVVLPSLIAAALDGPPSRNIPFGPGQHFCPGAALSRVWLAEALAGFFTAYPRARLVGDLDWQPGTLPVPRVIMMDLR